MIALQSLESVPTWFSDYFDISLEAGQSVLSLIVILSVLLPIMYFNRERQGFTIEIIMILLLEAFLVGIGWLPFWLLITTVAVLSIAVAKVMSEVVSGG